MNASERSARAHANGKLCEEQIMQLLPDFHPIEGGEVDGELFGDPAEIKSCQASMSRGDRKHPGSGRFYLRDYQHSKLLEHNGRYILAVTEGEVVSRTRVVLASKLSPEFEGCKTLTWRTVFKKLGGAC